MNNAIKDLRELPDHINHVQLLSLVRALMDRTETLEEKVRYLEDSVYPMSKKKEKKPLQKVKDWEPYIHKVLANGKIWSTWAVAEEIQLLHPEIAPLVNHSGIQSSMGRLAHYGKITKITHGNYRKNT